MTKENLGKENIHFPVDILVMANQRKTEFVGEKDGMLRVHVKGKAENNEANRELIRFFSKIAGRPVRILKGSKSKKKVIG